MLTRLARVRLCICRGFSALIEVVTDFVGIHAGLRLVLVVGGCDEVDPVFITVFKSMVII